MALPASGVISMSDMNTELGYSSTAQISLSSAGDDFGVSYNTSGTNDLKISEFYGLSAPSAWTSFNMDPDGYASSALACSQGIPSGTFYHDGAGSTPNVFDTVSQNSSGSPVFNGSSNWYLLGFESIQINSSGVVQLGAICQ